MENRESQITRKKKEKRKRYNNNNLSTASACRMFGSVFFHEEFV